MSRDYIGVLVHKACKSINKRATLLPSKESVATFSLMSKDDITLKFQSPERIPFHLGDWIDTQEMGLTYNSLASELAMELVGETYKYNWDASIRGLLANRYYITQIPRPSYDKTTGGWNYTVTFDAYYWQWNRELLLLPYFWQDGSTHRTDVNFSLTAKLEEQAKIILANLEVLGYKYIAGGWGGQEQTETPYQVNIHLSENTGIVVSGSAGVYTCTPYGTMTEDETVYIDDKVMTMTYNSIKIVDAMSQMCEEKNGWDCEWWVKDNVIHFGRLEAQGQSIILEDGDYLIASENNASGEFCTRLYSRGGMRNMPSLYRKDLVLTSNPISAVDLHDITDSDKVFTMAMFKDEYKKKVPFTLTPFYFHGEPEAYVEFRLSKGNFNCDAHINISPSIWWHGNSHWDGSITLQKYASGTWTDVESKTFSSDIAGFDGSDFFYVCRNIEFEVMVDADVTKFRMYFGASLGADSLYIDNVTMTSPVLVSNTATTDKEVFDRLEYDGIVKYDIDTSTGARTIHTDGQLSRDMATWRIYPKASVAEGILFINDFVGRIVCDQSAEDSLEESDQVEITVMYYNGSAWVSEAQRMTVGLTRVTSEQGYVYDFDLSSLNSYLCGHAISAEGIKIVFGQTFSTQDFNVLSASMRFKEMPNVVESRYPRVEFECMYNGDVHPVAFNYLCQNYYNDVNKVFGLLDNSEREADMEYYLPMNILNLTQVPARYYKDRDIAVVASNETERRLRMPANIGDYVDAESLGENTTEDDIIEGYVQFDDIYPHEDDIITVVTPDTTSVEKTDEITGETYTEQLPIYYIKAQLSSVNFSSEYILSTPPRINFKSGLLAGMSFDLRWNPEEYPGQGYWLISPNEDYGSRFPNDTLYPQVGDEFILTDINGLYLMGAIDDAEAELYARTAATLERKMRNDNTFTLTFPVDYLQENGLPGLGDKLQFETGSYYIPVRTERVIGYELKLDIPYDSPKIMVGETARYSRLSEIEKKNNQKK